MSKHESYSYSHKSKEGKDKTIRVREVENGYVVDVECYCEENGFEVKTYISKKNPMEGKIPDGDSFGPETLQALAGIFPNS